MRIDQLLVEKGLASSRVRAQDMIEKGVVSIRVGEKKQVVKKSSQQISPEQESSIEIDFAGEVESHRYVSRGGLKMHGALDRVKLDVRGFRVLDIGISTGGFTDCVLQAGAAHVVGIDVGRGQLADKLAKDPRVSAKDGVNARNLNEASFTELVLDMNHGSKFDLIVADVSFISLTLVLPALIQYLNEGAQILALVKPQFEVGREGLGKNGIVKDPSRYVEVERKIRQTAAALGLNVEDYFESSIEGADGNREFFIYARPGQGSLFSSANDNSPRDNLSGNDVESRGV